MEKTVNKLQEELQQLIVRYGPELDQYPWRDEIDRWKELLICLLSAVSPNAGIQGALEVLDMLDELDMLEPEKLISIKEKGNTGDALLIAALLKRYQFSDEEANLGVVMLYKAALAVKKQFQGKLQRFLRYQGEVMLDSLVEILGDLPLTKEILRTSVASWLQNVVNMPLFISTPEQSAFLQKNNATRNDLYEAADEVGFNVALLDELFAIADSENELISNSVKVYQK